MSPLKPPSAVMMMYSSLSITLLTRLSRPKLKEPVNPQLGIHIPQLIKEFGRLQHLVLDLGDTHAGDAFECAG